MGFHGEDGERGTGNNLKNDSYTVSLWDFNA